MDIDLESSLAVAPGDVVADGLFGMTAGQTIYAPMELTYDFTNPNGPGFVSFDRDLKGRNPCKNKTLNATVTRPTAADLWTVSVDSTATRDLLAPPRPFPARGAARSGLRSRPGSRCAARCPAPWRSPRRSDRRSSAA